MTRTTRWFLGSAALALAIAAAPVRATDGWAPPSFTFEAAEPHWLDAGTALPGARGDAPAAEAAPAEASDWKTEPSRYLGSPIYGRGILSSE